MNTSTLNKANSLSKQIDALKEELARLNKMKEEDAQHISFGHVGLYKQLTFKQHSGDPKTLSTVQLCFYNEDIKKIIGETEHGVLVEMIYQYIRASLMADLERIEKEFTDLKDEEA